MILLVLAAGMGQRYGGLKQIEPVGPCGASILEYSIYDAMRAGFSRVVFVIRPEMDALFRRKVIPRLPDQLDVALVHQRIDDLPPGLTAPAGRTLPWGTGHAVWTARQAITGPFGVINADDFYGAEAYQLLAAFFARPLADDQPNYALIGYHLGNTLSAFGSVSRAVCQLDNQRQCLNSITEHSGIRYEGSTIFADSTSGKKKSLPADALVSLNLFGLRPECFPVIETLFRNFMHQYGKETRQEFYLPDAIGTMVTSGQAQVAVLPTQASWFGVTYQEDKACVEDALRACVAQKRYPTPLWETPSEIAGIKF